MSILKKIPHLKQIIMFILIIVCFPFVISFAKFIKNTFYNYYLGSKEFYFTSNRLKEKKATYQVNNWSGVGSFDITFDLLSSLNNKLATSYDISYEVEYTCSEDATCNIDNKSGTIYADSHSTTVTINVVPKRVFNENEELRVNVIAKSTSPYVKELSAEFIYTSGKKGVTYSINDSINNPYFNFSVTNANNYCTVINSFDNYNKGDYIDVNDFLNLDTLKRANCVSKYVKLTFDPNEILIDTTSSLINNNTDYQEIDNVKYVKEITFPIDAVSSKELKFYKIKPSNDYTYPNDSDSSIIRVEIIDP